MLNSISKIFETCVKNRLEYAQEVSQTTDQCNGGFKKNSQTSDNVLLLYGAIQKCKFEKQNLYPLGIFGCFDVRVTSDSDVGSWLDFG